jgi:hypothetical protein
MLSWLSRACLYFSYAALILLGHCKELYERFFGAGVAKSVALKRVRSHRVVAFFKNLPGPVGSFEWVCLVENSRVAVFHL